MDAATQQPQGALTPAADDPMLRLVDLVDVGLLQELQDSLATAGQASIQVYDASGQPVTDPSCGAPLCEVVRQFPSGRAACRASAAALIGGGTPGGPAGLCHAGMRHHVAPITVMGRRVGAVLAGTAPAQPLTEAECRRLAAQHGPDPDTVRRASAATVDRRDDRPAVHELFARMVARLSEQRYEIRRRIEELSTVCDLTDMLSGTRDLPEVMRATASRVCAAMGAKACSIRLVDRDTGELRLVASHNLSREYVEKGVVRIEGNPLDARALAGETVYVADMASDPRVHYPEQAKQEGLVSGLSVPMMFRGEAVGVLRVYSGRRQRFTPFEMVLVRAIASQIAAAVTHSRLYQQRLAAERDRRQLQHAADIQRRMIPPLPQHPRISFGAVYDPQLEVGGDLYDFIQLGGGNLGVCIADVVGKGVPAALMMASVRASLRAHADNVYSISEITANVNRRLCLDTLVNEFATLFYGVFTPDAARFSYCNAGHEPPLLLRGDELIPLKTGGMVIGLDPDAAFQMDLLELRPGDLIVMVTDGITEALNFRDEPYGRQRLHESIRRYRDLEAPTLAQQLLWDVRRFAGLAPRSDDRTLVVAKIQ